MYQRPEPILIPITLARALVKDLADLEWWIRTLETPDLDQAIPQLSKYQQAHWPAARDLLQEINRVLDPPTDERPKDTP